MKLYVSGKMFSLHRKYFVKDYCGRDIYEISSKLFTIGHKTTIKNINGEEVAYIEQRVFRLMPTYDVYVENNHMCRINRKFSLLKKKYNLSNGYWVNGNFIDLNFKVYNSKNNEIASIKRKFFSLREKYEIDIHDEKDIITPLAVIVAITNDISDETAAMSVGSTAWLTSTKNIDARID